LRVRGFLFLGVHYPSSNNLHVTQRIFITAIPGANGTHLLENAQAMIERRSVIDYVHSLIDTGGLSFYSDHLDLWSMADSFDRLLRPKRHLRYFDGGSSQLYAIDCGLLRTPPTPRDEEERMLRTLICGAKALHKRADVPVILFVFRQVFTSFRETGIIG
jgi:hypothetical protein